MKKITALFFAALVLLYSPSLAFATEANLKCDPPTGTFSAGQSFTVTYLLDTRGFPVWGGNVQATYDSSVIDAQAAQSTIISTTTGWSTAVANTIDPTLGKINLDFGNAQTQFTGSGSIGSATFTGKAAGQAQFNFVFFQQYDNTTPGVSIIWGKKDDVNLSNILTEVNNCIYVIEAAAVPTATPVPGQPTSIPGQPTNTPAPTLLPEAGTTENTVGFGIIGSVLIFLGIGAPLLYKKINP